MKGFKSLQIYLSPSELEELIKYAKAENLSNSKAGKQLLLSALRGSSRNQEETSSLLSVGKLDGKLAEMEERIINLEDQIYRINLDDHKKNGSKVEPKKTNIYQELEIKLEQEVLSEDEKKELRKQYASSKISQKLEYGEDSLKEILSKKLEDYYIVCSSNTGEMIYWGGKDVKYGQPKISDSAIYKGLKSAKNTVRKAERKEDIIYEAVSALENLFYIPIEERKIALLNWGVDEFYQSMVKRNII